jgi:NAD(P)H dehydrogenase (quinone)
MTRLAVVYYSSTGHVHKLAEAIVAGAEETGAEVRLRRVAELAPEEVVRSQNAWHEHAMATRDTVEEASLDDLEWADGYAFGTPTRFGAPAAQLKQFLDTTGPLWVRGALANKTVTSFTSSMNRHGGQESTILALNNVFYHWGAIIVAPGYTDPLLYASGGNPYGTSLVTGQEIAQRLPEEIEAAARYQGRRWAQITGQLVGDAAVAGELFSHHATSSS